jgi:hypothetical protein
MGRSAISTGNQGKNERDLSVILLHDVVVCVKSGLTTACLVLWYYAQLIVCRGTIGPILDGQ